MSSGFFEELVVFNEHVKETEEWKFDEIYNNQKKKYEYFEWFAQKKAKELNVSEEEIVITKLKKGSIETEYLITNKAAAYKNSQK